MLQRGDIIIALSLGIIAIFLFYKLSEQLLQPPQPTARPAPPRQPPSHPVATMNTPYSEEVIVSIFMELYEVLVKICYVAEDWVTLAPPEGHAINTTLCKSLNIDPAVISLMKHLPYVEDKDPVDVLFLFPESRPFYYLDDQELRAGRDPELADTMESPRLDYLLPQDIAFTCGIRYGEAIVLDTKENTIRRIEGVHGPTGVDESELERPDDPLHYRNYSTEHAPTFLRQYVDRIKNLDLIPCGAQGWKGFYSKTDPEYPKMKKVITETYGWPDNFRQEDWRRDMDDLWVSTIKDNLDKMKAARE